MKPQHIYVPSICRDVEAALGQPLTEAFSTPEAAMAFAQRAIQLGNLIHGEEPTQLEWSEEKGMNGASRWMAKLGKKIGVSVYELKFGADKLPAPILEDEVRAEAEKLRIKELCMRRLDATIERVKAPAPPMTEEELAEETEELLEVVESEEGVRYYQQLHEVTMAALEQRYEELKAQEAA